MVNKDQVAGVAKQIKGSIKKVAGKATGVLTAQTLLPGGGYRDVASITRFVDDVSRRLGALPGVQRVSVTSVDQRAKPSRWYSPIAGVLASSTYNMTCCRPRSRRYRRPARVSAVPSPVPWADGSTPSTYTAPIGSW